MASLRFLKKKKKVLPTDPHFNNVVSLLHFNGDFTDIKGKNWTTYSSATSATSPIFGTHSLQCLYGNNYIDGSGSTDYAFGTADFTIEFFTKFTATTLSAPPKIIVDWRPTGTQGTYPVIYVDGTALKFHQSSADRIVSGNVLVADTRYHVALSRISGVTRLFLNGNKVGGDYGDTTNYLVGVGRPRVGAQGYGAGQGNDFTGTLDELRVTTGVGRYSANFTPPTTAFPNAGPTVQDPYFDNVVSLLHFDGNLTDQKGNTWTTSGNISTAGTAKFGSNSVSFDGTSQIMSADHADWEVGGGDFTVEFWVRPTAAGQSGYSGVFSKMTVATDPTCPVYIALAPGSYNLVLFSAINTAWDVISGATIGTLVQNQWHHVAVSRQGSNIRTFLNGVLGSTSNVGTTIYPDNNKQVTIGGVSWANCFFSGQIDEFRFTKGVARYTTNFTPPTAAFPTVQDTSGDTYFNQVVSLLHFDGSMADVKGHAWTVSSATTTGVAKFGTNSLELNGSSGASSPSLSAWSTVGAQDFCVEGWFQADAIHSILSPIFNTSWDGTGTGMCIWMHQNNPGKVALWLENHNVNNALLVSTTTITTGQWYHVAVSRTGGNTYRLFLNGVKEAEGTSGAALTRDKWHIGAYHNGNVYTAYYLDGRVDDFRVTVGAARYTATFTPPTAAFLNKAPSVDPYFTNVKCLLPFDGNLNDVKGKTWTPYNGATTTAVSKFGSGALDCSGTKHIVSATHDDWTIDTSDFTMECWVKFNSLPDHSGGTNSIKSFYFRYGSDSDRTYFCYHGWSGSPKQILFMNDSSAYGSYGATKIIDLAINTWYHVAVVRSGTSLTVFVDGVPGNSATLPANTRLMGGVNQPAKIGGAYSGVFWMDGTIDDFRFTKGIARYTGAFTPPAQALPGG